MDTHLNALQASADQNKKLYQYDKPNALLLEHFPNPKQHTRHDLTVHIEVPEFSSLCPLTGQPDFATIVIDYRPGDKCLESKSLKLYLLGYRQFGEFHEACVARIAEDLIKVLDPASLRVEGRFAPRGGIPFWPTLFYEKPAPVL